MSVALEEHSSTSTCEMSWLLPVRNSRVCCVSGPWLRSELEVWWGSAARREGPAGYKGEERAGEATPRDPTAAGDPGPGPRDDCEFKAATFVNTQQNTSSNLHSTCIHTLSVPCIITLQSVSIHRHMYDKLLQVHNKGTITLHAIFLSLQSHIFSSFSLRFPTFFLYH